MAYMKDSAGRRLDTFRSVGFDQAPFVPFVRGMEAGTLDVLHVGHSITEGARSTAVGQRWTDILRDRLRAELGVSGGFGYVPAVNTYPELLPHPWTVTGTADAGSNSDGLGRYYRQMSAGSTAALVFEGTGVSVRFTAYSGGPTVTATIDGVAAGSFSAASTSSDYSTSAYFDAGTEGTHTLVLSAPAVVNLHGAYVFSGDRFAGVRSWNGGHSGDTASAFSAGNGSTRIPPIYNAISPCLTTVEFLVNEYRTNVPARTAARDLGLVIDQVRQSVGNGAIVLVSDAEPSHPTAPVEPWANYKELAARVARNRNVMLFDVAELPGLGLSGSGMNADQIHPNATGHSTIGNALADELLALLA